MNSKMLLAGATAALLWTGSARADDTEPTTPPAADAMHPTDHHTTPAQAGQHDAVHSAMHDAMQSHMAARPMTPTQMPAMTDRAAGDAVAAQQRATQMQQDRDAARRRAMAHGAQDAAMASGSTATHGGMQPGQHGAMMGGDATGTQQGAGMMRTGDMHGGSGGMMPGDGGSGGMMPGGGGGTTTMPGTTSTTGGGTMPATGTGTTTPGTTGPMMK